MKKNLLFLSILAITFVNAQVSLVKDFNLGTSDGMPTFSFNRLSFNGNLIFSTNNGTTHEVWIIDSPSTQPILLENFTDASITPQYFTYLASSNRVYFTGQSNTIGKSSLWRYIGVTGLTSEVPFTSTKEIKYITEHQGRVYYQGNINPQGYEIFYKSPSQSGAYFYDVNTSQSSFPEELTSVATNSRLFYSAIGSSSTGRELFMHLHINNSHTEITINPAGDSNPKDFVTLNNKVYFTANNGSNGRELWVSDRTLAGTQMVLDIYAGSIGSNPENLTVFNNALYFTATHPTFGTEVFKMTAAENITNLKNIAPVNGVSSNPSNLFVFNGKLYFSADDNTNGTELWSTTGFSSTTNMVKDINTSPSTPDSSPSGFTEYNGKLYFSANDDTNGRELWMTDGTNGGTILVDDINTSGDSNPLDLIVANNLLFFSATTPATGKELFKYQDPTLSVGNIELESSISIFPNPTANSFSIESREVINNISIVNLQGKLIRSFEGKSELYSIDALSSGLYFVNIETDKGKITKKLIKQ